MSDPSRARDPKTGRFPKGSGLPATGAGWGGPANGRFAPPIGSGYQPPGAAIGAGIKAARTAAEAARPHAVRMVEVWRQIAEDETQPAPARVVAADKIVERAEGKPRERPPEPPPRPRYDISRLTLAQQKMFLGMLRAIQVEDGVGATEPPPDIEAPAVDG